MNELLNEINARLYKWEHTSGSATTRQKAMAKAEECKQIIKIIRRIQMLDKKEYIEVNKEKCSEVNICFGVKEEKGKKYCRGCGNHQPVKDT